MEERYQKDQASQPAVEVQFEMETRGHRGQPMFIAIIVGIVLLGIAAIAACGWVIGQA